MGWPCGGKFGQEPKALDPVPQCYTRTNTITSAKSHELSFAIKWNFNLFTFTYALQGCLWRRISHVKKHSLYWRMLLLGLWSDVAHREVQDFGDIQWALTARISPNLPEAFSNESACDSPPACYNLTHRWEDWEGKQWKLCQFPSWNPFLLYSIPSTWFCLSFGSWEPEMPLNSH